MIMLKIKDLTKKYSTLDGEIAALDGVSLTAADGEFIAIVGKSGSGKSTLLNMIGGLDIPDSGSILLDGTDIVKLSNRQTAILRRQKIGIIYQFYNLIPELNISENITLPAELDGAEPDREWLASILKTVGLDERENAYPNTLSGGQQQRVAIARALYNKPSLILADEPTGNLDAENGADIMRLLKDMNKQSGATVLIVTHSESVASEADRVITISDGRIADDRRQRE
ncbi:MAG: ABC transporter ATP-binding protein [Clostridia bacterium]|nr:ABC transporter ATP-binding protein [Clostridia bacterium]